MSTIASVLPLAISVQHIMIVLIIVIVFFGGKKIPELMRGMGRGVKEFKDAVNKDYTDDLTTPNETVKGDAKKEDNPLA